VSYADAEQIGSRLALMLEAGEFDVCTVFYNKFHSAISQVVTPQQLIPLDIATMHHEEMPVIQDNALHEYEPDEETILNDLLPRNIAVQVYHALLESAASEQGARMSAMDNATRNAGEMIKDLTLVYNRTRQAAITKELIEIISGAEAI
jgi:F-type H+-transporting ATPase subunit gamma